MECEGHGLLCKWMQEADPALDKGIHCSHTHWAGMKGAGHTWQQSMHPRAWAVKGLNSAGHACFWSCVTLTGANRPGLPGATCNMTNMQGHTMTTDDAMHTMTTNAMQVRHAKITARARRCSASTHGLQARQRGQSLTRTWLDLQHARCPPAALASAAARCPPLCRRPACGVVRTVQCAWKKSKQSNVPERRAHSPTCLKEEHTVQCA